MVRKKKKQPDCNSGILDSEDTDYLKNIVCEHIVYFYGETKRIHKNEINK